MVVAQCKCGEKVVRKKGYVWQCPKCGHIFSESYSKEVIRAVNDRHEQWKGSSKNE